MREVVTITARGVPAVPWSVPDVGVSRRGGRRVRFSKKKPRLVEWQRYVAYHARQAMTRKPIVTGPLAVYITFNIASEDPEKWGLPYSIPVEWSEKHEKYVKKGTCPDLTNLVKGTEDAIQGAAFADDVQIVFCQSVRLHARDHSAQVEIYELEEGEPV